MASRIKEGKAWVSAHPRRTLLIAAIVITVIFVVWRYASTHQPYLDYMPTAIEPCPSYYNCGATTKEQIAMENRLYSDLRESEKYALPATLTPDQIDVVASDAEPTSCMIKRAAMAREGPKPEGVHDTWRAVDEGFEVKRRKPHFDRPSVTMIDTTSGDPITRAR
jgi:hypothetical protein